MAEAAGASRAEVMAVAIARRLRDGETIAVGSVSPIPASACLLAKRLHAPSARLILLGSRAHFPFNGGVQEFYNFAVRGRLDVFFASGAQIDQHVREYIDAAGDDDTFAKWLDRYVYGVPDHAGYLERVGLAGAAR